MIYIYTHTHTHTHTFTYIYVYVQVRLYKEKVQLSVISCNDVVSAMRFGKYSREDNTLVLVFKSGSLGIKVFFLLLEF
jgi:hypothetical protein